MVAGLFCQVGFWWCTCLCCCLLIWCGNKTMVHVCETTILIQSHGGKMPTKYVSLSPFSPSSAWFCLDLTCVRPNWTEPKIDSYVWYMQQSSMPIPPRRSLSDQIALVEQTTRNARSLCGCGLLISRSRENRPTVLPADTQMAQTNSQEYCNCDAVYCRFKGSGSQHQANTKAGRTQSVTRRVTDPQGRAVRIDTCFIPNYSFRNRTERLVVKERDRKDQMKIECFLCFDEFNFFVPVEYHWVSTAIIMTHHWWSIFVSAQPNEIGAGSNFGQQGQTPWGAFFLWI